MSLIEAGSAFSYLDTPQGMDLSGYIARFNPSSGINDRLGIYCCALKHGTGCILLISCDLIGLDTDFVNSAAHLIEESTAIPAENIIISCIHTHSGTASIFLQDLGNVDSYWMENLKLIIAACAQEAVYNMKASRLFYGKGECKAGINRVMMWCRGDREAAYKERDTDVGVLVVRDGDDGRIDTVIVNYACHAVALGPDNLLYSADFPYFMRKTLAEKLGKEVNVIFFNGCAGDINPEKTGGFKEAEETGGLLAHAVMDAINNRLQEVGFFEHEDKETGVETLNVDIPLSYNLDESEIIRQRDEFTDKYKEALSGNDKVMARVYKAYMKWADRMYNKLKTGTMESKVNANIKIANFGSVKIIAIPFEPFHHIGLKLKEHFKDLSVMVLGYSNGLFGYLPSKMMYHIADYETGSAFRYYGYPGPVCENAEDIILYNIFSKTV